MNLLFKVFASSWGNVPVGDVASITIFVSGLVT